MTIAELVEHLENFSDQDKEVFIQYYATESGSCVAESIKAIAIDGDSKNCVLMACRDWSLV